MHAFILRLFCLAFLARLIALSLFVVSALAGSGHWAWAEANERGLQMAQANGGGVTTITKTPRMALVRNAKLSGDTRKTVFRVGLSRGVPAEVFTLGKPYRVVIDLPDAKFVLSDDVGRKGRGLVSSFRFGLFAPRKGRLVLDTIAPVRIQSATMVPSPNGAVVLELTLLKTDLASFGEGTGATRSRPAMRTAPSKKPQAAPKKSVSKPVVVIDAGHGGIDPGALGSSNTHEKQIVLAVAQRLEKRLLKSGRYLVHMTRDKDVFLSLDQRLQESRTAGSDIFVSLHADSIADKRYARSISGATIYTLSDRASDEEARLIAEKENNADALAGVAAAGRDEAPEVRDILIDLLKRETANFATDLANVVVEKLRGKVRLSRKPKKSADFKVLRQTRTPSVLIELGYMSNERDVKMMAGAQWQSLAAGAIGEAIETYFARRSRQAR